MKTVERLLIKLIIIQFIGLAVFQFFLRTDLPLFQSRKLVQYEGVSQESHEKVVETFNQVNNR